MLAPKLTEIRASRPEMGGFNFAQELVITNFTGCFKSPIYGIDKLYILWYNIYKSKEKEVIKMTVKEIKSAVAHMRDDEEIKFVIRVYDTYGYPDEFSINDVVGIIKNNEE